MDVPGEVNVSTFKNENGSIGNDRVPKRIPGTLIRVRERRTRPGRARLVKKRGRSRTSIFGYHRYATNGFGFLSLVLSFLVIFVSAGVRFLILNRRYTPPTTMT